MTHATLTLAAIFAIALLLREAWERGRRSGLEEPEPRVSWGVTNPCPTCGAGPGEPCIRDDVYEVTGI